LEPAVRASSNANVLKGDLAPEVVGSRDAWSD
jgi:hypothetical protein